jgi:hypothetical protein
MTRIWKWNSTYRWLRRPIIVTDFEYLIRKSTEFVVANMVILKLARGTLQRGQVFLAAYLPFHQRSPPLSKIELLLKPQFTQ